LAGVALGTALLAKEKNVGVNELPSGTGGTASVCPDVFVVRSFCGGRDECVRINGNDGYVLARLAFINSDFYASGTSIRAFGASAVKSFLIKSSCTVLNTDVTFEINSGTKVGQSTRETFFGVVDTSFAVGITKNAGKAGGIGVSTIETSIRALGGS
jgi:hypothetical protein